MLFVYFATLFGFGMLVSFVALDAALLKSDTDPWQMASTTDSFVAMSNLMGGGVGASAEGDAKRRKVGTDAGDDEAFPDEDDSALVAEDPQFIREIDENIAVNEKLLNGRMIVSRIMELAGKNPSRDLNVSIREFADRTMTAPLALNGKHVAGPLQIVDPLTVIKIVTDKKRNRLLAVEYRTDPADPASCVTADYIAIGGICDTKRGYIQSIHKNGNTLEQMLGSEGNPGHIRSMKGKLKPLNSSVFYFYVNDTTSRVMGATEIDALVKTNFTSREDLSAKEHDILVAYATRIIEVSSAAVDRLLSVLGNEFPQVRANGPFLSTSKEMLTFTEKHTLPRTSMSCNQSTLLWTSKPSQFFATGIYSSVNPAEIATISGRLASFSSREGVYPVVRPPILKMGVAPFTEYVWNPRFKLTIGFSLVSPTLRSYPGVTTPSDIFTSMSTYFTIGLHGLYHTSAAATASSYMPTSVL
jgi:hypothetical protein